MLYLMKLIMIFRTFKDKMNLVENHGQLVKAFHSMVLEQFLMRLTLKKMIKIMKMMRLVGIDDVSF